MPYDPIRDSSSSSSSKLSPTTPNGTVYTNPLESPSSSFRPLSSGSGGSHPPPFESSSTGEGTVWSPAGTSGGGVAVVAGETGTGAERRGAPPPPPPTKRLSLSMLLNDNQKEEKEDALVDMEAAGRHPSTPRSSSFPILQSSSAPPTSYRTSPSGHQLPLPSSSSSSSSSSYPPPPAFGPRRTSNTSTTSHDSVTVHSPSSAPPGFTDAHAMPASNDTAFVMDAVVPSIKRKRDSLTVDGAAGARRKSSTSSVASRSSSGRNSSISAEAGSSSTSSDPKRPPGATRKDSSSSSTTSAVLTSVPLPPPPPHHLTQSSSLRSTILQAPFESPPSALLPPAPISPHTRQPTPTSSSSTTTSSSLPQHPSHLPPRPAGISPTTSSFPPPPPHHQRKSASAANVPPSSPPHPPSSMAPPPPPSPLDPSAPRRTSYAPRNRTSAPRSVLVPLSREEYNRWREHPEQGSQNPMRGKGPPKPKVSNGGGAASSSSSNGSHYPPPSSTGPSRPSSSAGPVVAAVGGGGGREEGEGESSGGLVSPTGVHGKRSGEFEDGSGGDRRRRLDGAGGYVNADVAKVADHYNARPEVGRENRHLSPIIGLKNFNNWVKSVLIGKFTRPGPPPDRRAPPQGVVLDLGCGKGGDLLKWNIARVQHYMGFDIAEVSVSQASERARGIRNPTFSFEFYQLDCFAEPITKIIPEQRLLQYPIDVVTMQFCMHYAFETEEKARMMLDNVSRYLRPGGTFVGTIPNAEKLIENLQAIPEDAERLAFGNEVYEISFDDRENFPIYGHRYSFFLNDAVEDVPEYLVHWDNFESLAGEYGLQLIYRREFHDVFEEERETSEFGPLLKRMKVMNEEGESEMTEDQFAAANLYLAFAFQKQ